MKKYFAIFLSIFVVTAFVGLTFRFVLAAFTEPAKNPPIDNILPLWLEISSGKIIPASSQSVGIIQTSPTAKLVVNTVNTALKTGSSGDAFYAYADSVNSAISAEQANSTGYAGYFSGKVKVAGNLEVTGSITGAGGAGISGPWQTSGSDIYYNAGKVGIGIASPGSKLEVNGDIKTTSGNQAIVARYTTGSDTYSSSIIWNTGIGGVLTLGNNGANEIRAGKTRTGGNLRFIVNNTAAETAVNDGITAMTIISTGKVGIGTTSPGQTLEVNGTAQAATFYASNGISTFDTSVGAGTIEATKMCLGNGINCITSWPSGIVGSGTANYIPKFTTTNTLGNSLIYDNGTKIGIGIASPSEVLSVNGAIALDGTATTAANGGMFRHTNGVTYFVGKSNGVGAALTNGDGSASLRTYSPGGSTGYVVMETGAGTERMRIDAEGKVGIGVANPKYKLDIRGGQINASGGLCIAGDCKTVWPDGVSGSGTTGYIPKFTAATTIGNSLIYDNGTYVGIGTTQPGAKLDVNGSANFANGEIAIKTTETGSTVLDLAGLASNTPPSNNNVWRTYDVTEVEFGWVKLSAICFNSEITVKQTDGKNEYILCSTPWNTTGSGKGTGTIDLAIHAGSFQYKFKRLDVPQWTASLKINKVGGISFPANIKY